MAAATCRCSSVVFVGNIPYHASEEELRSACEEIGPVVSLRIVADKDTGRRRGFAFCEYLDDETALSACRNLDGSSLRGRALRVRLADRSAGQGRARGDDQPVGAEDAAHAATLLVRGARPSQAVTAHLAGMTPRQLRELVHAVDAEDPALVEAARRAYVGFATLVEQARVLLDMAAAAAAEGKDGAARKRPGGGSTKPATGQEAQKLRRLEDGKSGVACR